MSIMRLYHCYITVYKNETRPTSDVISSEYANNTEVCA